MQNLMPEPPPVLLPVDEAAAAALASAPPDDPAELKAAAARFPAYSDAWARLAERALATGDPVSAYAPGAVFSLNVGTRSTLISSWGGIAKSCARPRTISLM